MGDARRQLRSGTVVLGGMGVLAAALTACSAAPDKRCVDRDSYTLAKGYRVVADKNCASPGDAWYYGGTTKSGWVRDGSFTKPRSGTAHGGGIHRGGFGGGHGTSGG
jgi:hypothetical protein